jgi:endo-1,4-beta-xylanase
MKILLFSLFIASIGAHLKDSAKSKYIGTALTPSHFSDSEYKTVAGAEFNCLTPENEMKWDAVEGSKGNHNFGPGDQLVQFAQQHGMKVRGHTLVWHAQVPGWVQNLQKQELHTTMITHIKDVMTHFKGKIYAWDVVNEVFDESGHLRQSLWSRNFNNTFIAEAFKTARSVDPMAKLYINDYNIESMNAKSNGLYNLVKQLKSEGVPIDGVGFQSHLGVGRVPGDMQQNLQRFASLGVDVAITELDIAIHLPSTQTSLNQQATDYAKVFSDCEAVSRCVGVTVWGFTDKYTWISNGDPTLFDKNYHPKPAVAAVTKVLH